MSRKRHVIEGIWSGYSSQQRRVVHREVTTMPSRFEHLRCIVYGDGTMLELRVRPCKPRERVREIHGYTSLIRNAARLGKGTVSVQELRS